MDYFGNDIEEHAQTGIRLEKRVLKVLKAIAEYNDETPSELLEQILRHAYEGAGTPFFDPKALERIRSLKSVYGLDEPSGDRGSWIVAVENFDKEPGVSRHRTNTAAYDFAIKLVRKSNEHGVKMRRGGVQGDGRRWDSRDQHNRSILIRKDQAA